MLIDRDRRIHVRAPHTPPKIASASGLGGCALCALRKLATLHNTALPRAH